MADDPLLFDQTIKKIEILYKFAGMNIRSGEQIPFNLKSRLTYIFNFSFLIIDYLGGCLWFVCGIFNGTDFLLLTDVATCAFLASSAKIKGILEFANEKNAHDLIAILRRLEMEDRRRAKTLNHGKIKEMVMNEKKLLEATYDKLFVLFAAVVVSFSISPILIMIVKYHETNEVEFFYPILIKYWFDSFQWKYWPFVYLHQVWSECVVCLNIITSDYFFFACCTYINIQFRILTDHFENIVPVNEAFDGKFMETVEFRNKMKDLIKWHQDLIESANILEIIYSKSTLTNFMTSSMMICLSGFNVTVASDDLTYVAKFVSFLFLALVQIYYLCFFADRLTDSTITMSLAFFLTFQSIGVSEAVYNNRWYSTEPKIAKDMLTILIRAQRPCKVTAFGFADINLNSFMRVLSTSYSYFALLQTMYAGAAETI